MMEQKTSSKKIRIVIFCEEEATKNLLAKVAKKRGYEVLPLAYPKDCTVSLTPGCCCTKEERCAEIMILGRHFYSFKALDFLISQVNAGCRLTPENKLVIASTYNAQEEERAKKLGIKISYLPFSLVELNAWLDECQERLKILT